MANFFNKLLQKLTSRFRIQNERSSEQANEIKELERIIKHLRKFQTKSVMNVSEYELIIRKSFQNMPPELDTQLTAEISNTLSGSMQAAYEKSNQYLVSSREIWDGLQLQIAELKKAIVWRDEHYIRFVKLDKRLKKYQKQMAALTAQIPADEETETTPQVAILKTEAAQLAATITDISTDLYAQMDVHKTHDTQVKDSLTKITEAVKITSTIMLCRITLSTTSFYSVMHNSVMRAILPPYLDYVQTHSKDIPPQVNPVHLERDSIIATGRNNHNASSLSTENGGDSLQKTITNVGEVPAARFAPEV